MIYRATLRAICRLLGYDPDDVTEIHIYRDSVDIHTIERDRTGVLLATRVNSRSIGEGVPS